MTIGHRAHGSFRFKEPRCAHNRYIAFPNVFEFDEALYQHIGSVRNATQFHVFALAFAQLNWLDCIPEVVSDLDVCVLHGLSVKR